MALSVLFLSAAFKMRTTVNHRERQAPAMALLLAALTLSSVPLVLGLDPTAAASALVAYGGKEGTGGQAVLDEVLGPRGLQLVYVLSMLGWVAASYARRTGVRRE